MTHKERYDQINKAMPVKLQRTPEQVIKNIVNQLIAALYIPVKGDITITSVDPDRVDLFGIESEPINWGGVRCGEVEAKKDGSYLVTIYKASPDNCPTFCRYIEEYMLSYGWSVAVVTEW